ncbi:hypothetical protein DFH27DRAFT_197266 [Peziza echinospora]|nr:hypothetical protein DFH27DRAFT_197266 [Peziza echinospora]
MVAAGFGWLAGWHNWRAGTSMSAMPCHNVNCQLSSQRRCTGSLDWVCKCSTHYKYLPCMHYAYSYQSRACTRTR